jgi:tRNA pseudouridine65 synthase
MEIMLLHASHLEFTHPVTGETVQIDAGLQPEFDRVMQIMGW